MFPSSKIITVLSFAIFVSGVINIISAIWSHTPDRIALLIQYVPLIVSHTTRSLTIVSGIFLILLSQGLSKRKRRAWLFSVWLLLISLAFHALNGLNWEEALVLIFPLGILIFYKDLFVVESSRPTIRSRLKYILLVLISLSMYLLIGFLIFKDQLIYLPSAQGLTESFVNLSTGLGDSYIFPLTNPADWFLNSIKFIELFAILFSVSSIFAPLTEKSQPSEDEQLLADNLVRQYSTNSVAYFSLSGDKKYFFRNNCLVAYKIAGDTAVVLGDILGPASDVPETFNEFIKFISQKGLAPVFFNVNEPMALLIKNSGWKIMPIGLEAVIDTLSFDMSRPELKSIRYSANKIEKLGAEYKWFSAKDIPWEVLKDIDSLYHEWIGEKRTPQLKFSQNYYPLPVDENVKVLAIYSPQKSLWAALSFLPYQNGESYSLDLMIRNKNTPYGAVAAGIVRSIGHMKERGIRRINLGLAPLAAVDLPKFLLRRLNTIYKHHSLFEFKKQFEPVWNKKYIALSKYTALPKATLAIFRAHTA